MRKNRLLMLLSIALVFTFAISPVVRADSPTIDLTRDVNKDGIPDALADAVTRVEMSDDKQAAIADMVGRLPYSPQTRALQKEAELLQAQLAKAKDDQEAEKIINQLRALSEQMMTDPGYAKTIEALTARLVPASHESGKAIDGVISPTSVSWGSLNRSHIMLVRSSWLPWTAFVYAMWYSHAGTYDGNSSVYESNADGVRLKPLSQWKQSGQYIGLGYNNKRSLSQTQSSLNWAKNKYGTNGRTPFNYFLPDKWTDSRQYCSQLVWKIHNNTGVNVDSNNWTYQLWVAARWGTWITLAVTIPAVAPDEIGLSSNVTMYSTGWN